MKISLFLSAAMLFLLVAHSTSYCQDCDSALKLTRTDFEAHSKSEFIEKVMSYYEEHRNNSSDSKFGLAFGATVPIKGVPVPMNLKSDKANFSQELNDAINKYERENQLKLESNIKFSFVPQTALQNWMECKKLPYIFSAIDIQNSIKPQGDSILVDLWLKQNSKDVQIKTVEIRSGGRTYKTQDLINMGKFRTADLRLTDTGHFAFTFDKPTPTSDFKFFLLAERYSPVTAYFPTLSEARRSLRLEINELNLSNSTIILPHPGWGEYSRGAIFTINVTATVKDEENNVVGTKTASWEDTFYDDKVSGHQLDHNLEVPVTQGSMTVEFKIDVAGRKKDIYGTATVSFTKSLTNDNGSWTDASDKWNWSTDLSGWWRGENTERWRGRLHYRIRYR